MTGSIQKPTPESPQEPREKRNVELRGRMVAVQDLVDAQMMLLAREAKVLRDKNSSNDRKMSSVGRMFTVLESALVEPDDRDYMNDLIATGDLDLRELVAFVTAFETDAVAEVKPKVRRGRPTTRKAE